MAALSVHLQEGFDVDRVIVRVDGRTQVRREQVTTRLLLGYAEIIEVPIPAEGEVTLQISLPRRRIAGTLTLRPKPTTNVGVNVVGRELVFAVREQPFMYA